MIADRARIGSILKHFLDTVLIVQIQIIPMLRHWYFIILASAAFPLPMFYVFQSIAPDDPAVTIRLLAGTLIFGVAFSTAMLVGQAILAQRFLGAMKILITMPVSKVSYVIGTLLYTSITGALSASVIIVFGFLTDIPISPTWMLLPVIVLTLLSLSGLTIFVVSFAPTLQVGNVLASVFGIVLVVISPVYFTQESAPIVLQWLGTVSPLRYAADAMTTTLSGRDDVWLEALILVGFALGSMALGIWRLPWREK